MQYGQPTWVDPISRSLRSSIPASPRLALVIFLPLHYRFNFYLSPERKEIKHQNCNGRWMEKTTFPIIQWNEAVTEYIMTVSAILPQEELWVRSFMIL